MKKLILLYSLMTLPLLAQVDTIKYQWPVPPLTSSQGLSATFCEFRDTESSDHFHDAVDIPEPDGNPVYSGLDGFVHYIGLSGSNSYVMVRTFIDGKYKKIIYLHIVPNPNLGPNSIVIKGETILGTIYSGMGHVHLTEKELGADSNAAAVDINPVRPNGGLEPYFDTYPPVIHSSSLIFKKNGTAIEMPSNSLSGKVDIIIKIEERNGTSSIYQNNGTYIAGYRIWSSDASTIVYEPDDLGIKYKFDRQPSNTYVHTVFVAGVATLSNPVYILTNGDGESYINQSNVVSDNYLDTDLLAEGNYLLEIFAEDTRQNSTNQFFPITVSKDPPVLKTVLNTDGKQGLDISWESFPSPETAGYRIYYSTDGSLTNWALAADELMINAEATSYSFTTTQDFLVPTSSHVYYFYVTAVDSSGAESKQSDIYSRSSYVDGTGFKSALIVDGYDRYGESASWNESFHSFNTNYFNTFTASDSIVISSCSNEAVLEGDVNLADYDLVIWFVGDEARAENTFVNQEQAKCAAYLEGGGNLLVSGDNIGNDLDLPHTYSELSDTLFYRHYLKAKFEHDGLPLLTNCTGAEGTIFQGLLVDLGQNRPDDYPDDIEPINGAETILNYNFFRNDGVTYRKGGIAYQGTFGSSGTPGKMIYTSFGLESVGTLQLDSLTEKILQYFDFITDINHEDDIVPQLFSLSQNYPNPFNPTTKIKYFVGNSLNEFQTFVSLKIYDLLGREVETLINELQKAGSYEIEFNAAGLASGVYFVRMEAGDGRSGGVIFSQTKSMLLLK